MINMHPNVLNIQEVNDSYEFASKAHKGQTRRYTREPYITHPLAVAQMLFRSLNKLDTPLLCAAMLHDTLEDTNTTEDELKQCFGTDVTQLVIEVTEFSTLADGNRFIRKELDRRYLKRVSNRAKALKLADLIHNSRSIIEHAKNGFAEIYMTEKKLLIEDIKEGNFGLYQIALKIIEDYELSKNG